MGLLILYGHQCESPHLDGIITLRAVLQSWFVTTYFLSLLYSLLGPCGSRQNDPSRLSSTHIRRGRRSRRYHSAHWSFLSPCLFPHRVFPISRLLLINHFPRYAWSCGVYSDARSRSSCHGHSSVGSCGG